MTEEEKEKLLNGDTQAPEADDAGIAVPPETKPIPEGEPPSVGDEVPNPEATEPPVEPEPPVRTFTQDEVNAIVGRVRQEARAKAREEYAAELRERYGVGNDSEIDDLIGNGQRFDALSGEYDSQASALGELKAENALLKSGVPEDRFDDVKAILAYKGLEVTPENIAVELATHPEWGAGTQPAAVPQPPMPAKPEPQPQAQPQPPMRPNPSVVQKLGGEPQGRPQGEDEAKAEFIRKMFGR